MKKIFVRSSNGSAPTELSAFDKCLCEMGIGNANLVHLSSVVPKGFSVQATEEKDSFDSEHFGDRLYCVYANNQTSTVGKSIAAGLGWVMTKDDEPWGLFVEHIADSEAEVVELIEKSLASMMKDRPEFSWGKINTHTVGTTCTNQSANVIVLATYKREDW